MELLTWNVAGRVRDVARQAAALAAHRVDVIALQEVRAGAAPRWREELGRQGFRAIAASLEGGEGPAEPTRRLGVLVAARRPFGAAPGWELPWPERHLGVLLADDDGPIELHCLHVPISSKPMLAKVRTLEAIAEHLARPTARPVVVAGDLNTPQYESRAGAVQSFARTRAGHLRPERGDRHDRAELAIIPGLADHGFVDAFRSLHGYAARDRSWLYPNGRTGYRLDHILVRGLRPRACHYLHSLREQRLSDHSPLLARLERG